MARKHSRSLVVSQRCLLVVGSGREWSGVVGSGRKWSEVVGRWSGVVGSGRESESGQEVVGSGREWGQPSGRERSGVGRKQTSLADRWLCYGPLPTTPDHSRPLANIFG